MEEWNIVGGEKMEVFEEIEHFGSFQLAVGTLPHWSSEVNNNPLELLLTDGLSRDLEGPRCPIGENPTLFSANLLMSVFDHLNP